MTTRARFALWLLRRWAPDAFGQIKQCRHEQSKRAALMADHRKLLAAHELERHRHRVKIADCDQLKALTDPALLAAWKTSRPARRMDGAPASAERSEDAS